MRASASFLFFYRTVSGASAQPLQQAAANDTAQHVFVRRVLENTAAKLQGHTILRQLFLIHR